MIRIRFWLPYLPVTQTLEFNIFFAYCVINIFQPWDWWLMVTLNLVQVKSGVLH